MAQDVSLGQDGIVVVRYGLTVGCQVRTAGPFLQCGERKLHSFRDILHTLAPQRGI